MGMLSNSVSSVKLVEPLGSSPNVPISPLMLCKICCEILYHSERSFWVTESTR